MKKQILLAASLLMGGLMTVQAQSTQKIGFVDGQYIYNQMPEVKAASTQLETYGKQLQASLKSKEEELERKYKGYMDTEGTMTDALKTATQKELQGLQEQIQIQQRDAQLSLQKKESDLLKPIEDKISKAIKDVATENGFTYILSKEQLLHFPEGDNISNLVLKKLGITPAPATTNNATKPK